jgi:CRP-like cAMP-binding protein
MTVYDELALHPAVVDLPGVWLRRLADSATSVTLPRWARLAREGSPADRFWLLLDGTVVLDFRIPGRGNLPVGRVRAGDLLGWSWLIRPYRWTTGAAVVEQCRAIELRASPVRELIAEDPAFGAALTARVLAGATERLQVIRQRLAVIGPPAG